MVEKNKMFQLFANLFMCILCVLCILPFMLLFASSLTNERTLIQDVSQWGQVKWFFYCPRGFEKI